VHFAGRLGTYRYYNMDQVVAQALTLYKNLAEKSSIKEIIGTNNVKAKMNAA
jgi:UDP-galactopyranose mutase